MRVGGLSPRTSEAISGDGILNRARNSALDSDPHLHPRPNRARRQKESDLMSNITLRQATHGGAAEDTNAVYWPAVGVADGVGDIIPLARCSPASFAPVSASELGVLSF